MDKAPCEWISVNDGLPVDEQTVLIVDMHSGASVPILGWFEACPQGFYAIASFQAHRCIVTHWMAVPTPPFILQTRENPALQGWDESRLLF